MGDSKVTVWERNRAAEVAVERQMVTCGRREESVETRPGDEQQRDPPTSPRRSLEKHTHTHIRRRMIIACGRL